MKILVLPAYYYPEQAASPYLGDNIREAMCNAGFILDLYAPMPTRGVSEEIRVEYKERKIEYKYDNKLVIHRFPMYSEGKNPINRALRYGICWCVQFGKGLCAKDIDLIYLASTPPIQGALGCLLKKIKRVPFVYNLQDIFPDSLAGTGLVRKDGLIWRIGRVVENFTYKHADKIIVISEGFKRNIMAKGVPEEKIVVVYNWVDQNAVKNYGGEITLGWQQQLDKFSYFIKGNFSYAKNEIVNINEEYHPYKYMYATGNSIGQLYGLMAEGLYQKEDFDAQGNLLPGLPVSTYESELRPGDVKYKDLNGDGKIDDYDHCHQQYSTLPEIYYGFSLGADYRNWGIKAHFQGVAHRSVSTMLASIYHPLYGNDKNVSEHYLENRWTDATPDARYPRLTTLSNNHNFQTSSLWMEKGDYLKLRVLELSYKLPARFAEKMRMSDCRLFLKGMNLFSIDHVGIMDPEQMDMEYPSSRSYLIGINVLF